MVKPCFGANEDVWVVCGDEVTKFGCFVLDTLEFILMILRGLAAEAKKGSI